MKGTAYERTLALRKAFEQLGKQKTEEAFREQDADRKAELFDQARVYWEMASAQADMFERRTFETTAQNKGQQQKTLARLEFLRRVAAEYGKADPAILAVWVSQEHEKEVRKLWPGKKSEREAKVRNFLKNHPL